MIRPGEEDVNIGTKTLNNKRFDTHEAVQAFYKINLSKKKMLEIHQEKSLLLKVSR